MPDGTLTDAPSIDRTFFSSSSTATESPCRTPFQSFPPHTSTTEEERERDTLQTLNIVTQTNIVTHNHTGKSYYWDCFFFERLQKKKKTHKYHNEIRFVGVVITGHIVVAIIRTTSCGFLYTTNDYNQSTNFDYKYYYITLYGVGCIDEESVRGYPSIVSSINRTVR